MHKSFKVSRKKILRNDQRDSKLIFRNFWPSLLVENFGSRDGFLYWIFIKIDFFLSKFTSLKNAPHQTSLTILHLFEHFRFYISWSGVSTREHKVIIDIEWDLFKIYDQLLPAP